MLYIDIICDKMKTTIIIEKLNLLNKKYITRDELKVYCKNLNKDYYNTIIYLTRNKYLIRILRGIFYVPSLEERKYNKINISLYEIITEALKIKGINNWYFGLDSAIKLNNITHETTATEYVVNDKIFRPRPILILGKKIKFIKLKKELLTFGITKEKTSDLEKTILDIIYLAKYNKEKDKEILNKIIDLLEICNKPKIKKYSKYYPKTITKIIDEHLK
jgi:predicted transcriptional regulator of viral defense system